jgi:hypothetical protein
LPYFGGCIELRKPNGWVLIFRLLKQMNSARVGWVDWSFPFCTQNWTSTELTPHNIWSIYRVLASINVRAWACPWIGIQKSQTDLQSKLPLWDSRRYGGAILLNPSLLPIRVAASNRLCPNASQEGLGSLDTNFPIPSYWLIRDQVKSRAKLRIQSFGSEILWIPLHL